MTQKKANRIKSLATLFSLVKPYAASIFGASVIGALTILSNTGLLAVSAILISMAALMPPVLDMMPMSAAVRLCGISRALFRYWERLATHSITLKLLSDLRVWYYRQLLPLVPGGVGNRTARLFKTITEDIETLKFFYIRVVAAPLTALLTLLFVTVILAFALPEAIIVLWIAAALGGLILPLLVRRQSRKNASAATEASLLYHQKLQDYIQGLEDLWMYDRCQQSVEDLRDTFLRGSLLRQNSEVRRGHLNALTGVLAALAMAATLFLGALAVTEGALSGIHLLAVAMTVYGALEAVQALPLAVSYCYESMASMSHILDVLDTKPTGLPYHSSDAASSASVHLHTPVSPEKQDPPAPVTPKHDQNTLPRCPIPPAEIHFSHVTFTYPGKTVPALRGAHLTFPAGSHTAIIGEIGSGKSTLAALLLGDHQPQSGIITLGGQPLFTLGKAAICDHISLVEQHPFLFTASLRENLSLACRHTPSDDSLWQALEWAELYDLARSLPKGLDTLLSPQGQNFSAGERQRLALARMVLENKPIIILDESLKHLDNITAQTLRHRILNYTQNRTLIWITHNLRYPNGMDLLLCMQGGCIVEQKPMLS